jgi:hypothetical protein
LLQRLNVALVYNVKKELVEDIAGDDGEAEKQKSKISTAHDATLQKTKADTYAEWDTEETILAVKTALEQKHNVTLI